ncbi:MAG: LysR family transcriptional regulator [Pseudomonadota bacterium]
MGQIEDLRLFVAVVDNGGIARAAEKLNIAKSAVSRRLGQLEDRFGVRLIDRQPHLWEVTTAGQELYQRAAQMVADADELDADFSQEAQSLKGPLSVSIAREFGLSFLTPILLEFIEQHPEIELTLEFDDRTVDLERKNFDMAIRVSADQLAGLVAVPLGRSRHGLYASSKYLAANGRPSDLEELARHRLLHYGAVRRAHWEFLCEGKKRSIQFQPALNSNAGAYLLNAALAGIGIARLPDFIVQETLNASELEIILPECEI